MKKQITIIILSLILSLGFSTVTVMAEDSQNVAKNVLNSLKEMGNPSESSDVFTFYISGIDTRGEMTESSRSDVNIIAAVNTNTKQILLVSTPRDYYVPLSISDGVPDKLTHAGIYGVKVCVETMELLYDIDIDYYFRLNFKNFVNFIDALGSITVHSDYEFDIQTGGGYHVVVGDNLMDGETALAFARERYSFASGDRQRGKNQMYVIQGVLNKLSNISPDGDTDVLSTMAEGFFETDMPLKERIQLILTQVPQLKNYQISLYSVDGTGATEKPYSMSETAYVMIPDQDTVEHAKGLMAQVRDGEIPVVE